MSAVSRVTIHSGEGDNYGAVDIRTPWMNPDVVVEIVGGEIVWGMGTAGASPPRSYRPTERPMLLINGEMIGFVAECRPVPGAERWDIGITDCVPGWMSRVQEMVYGSPGRIGPPHAIDTAPWPERRDAIPSAEWSWQRTMALAISKARRDMDEGGDETLPIDLIELDAPR